MIKFILLFMVVAANFLCAHTDTGLVVEGDKLVGLPEEYGECEFNWEEKYITINDKRVNLRGYENYIPFEQEYDVYVAASWYHDKEIMPYYVNISLTPKDRTFRYSLLLDLRTMEPLSLSLIYNIKLDNYIRHVSHEIKIRPNDLKNIKSRVEELK